MSELNEFLKDLDIKQDSSFEKPLTEPTEEPEKEETEEEAEFKAHNRRERRLVQENQRLREEAIAASSRAQALSEVNKFREEAGDDPLKKVEAIFGTDTPEKLAATNILKEALEEVRDTATRTALNKIDERAGEETESLKVEERNLEDIESHVEDEYGIDFSDDSSRKGYYTLLEKLSPKDRDGNIIEYADPDTTAEVFLNSQKKTSSRAKELASRGMTQSGASQPSKIEDDASVRFLKENGII